MDATFETIGLEVPSEKAINFLAERAENQGEPTQLSRRGAVLHGRCWKLGQGLEVWTVLYESGTGDVFYANCRPGFRARYMQRIAPWALTEYDEEGEAIVHGYCDGSDTEVLFELQNLTEVGAAGFRAKALHVGLCGLAYRARVCAREMNSRWLPLEQSAPSRAAHENDWSLRGQVLGINGRGSFEERGRVNVGLGYAISANQCRARASRSPRTPSSSRRTRVNSG